MGLDSVEIVLEVEESFSIDIPNEAAVSMRTPRQMTQYIMRHVPLQRGEGCRFQRSFFRVRRGLKRQLPALASAVERDTRLQDILPRDQWPALWSSIRDDVGEPDWPARIPWHVSSGRGHEPSASSPGTSHYFRQARLHLLHPGPGTRSGWRCGESYMNSWASSTTHWMQASLGI